MQAIFILTITIIILTIIWCFIYIFTTKNDIFCVNYKNIYNLFLVDKNKNVFKSLPKSHVNNMVNYLFFTKQKPLFHQAIIFKNKNFLLTISKLVDFKINSNKQKYRSKNNKILIDELSTLVAQNILISNKNNLFATYKLLTRTFSIRQKENKIFKILLAQKLLLLLCKLNDELFEVSSVITKSKKRKNFKVYKKQINMSAEIYSIKNFNSNSTKLLFKKNLDIDIIINKFFYELYESEHKIKRIVTYLVTMFS